MAKGIAVRVFSELDMAAVAAAVMQMKGIWGKAGSEINASLSKEASGLRALQDEMINSSNRAARAQIQAERDAANAIIAERKARNAKLIAEDKQTDAQRRAILMAPVARDRFNQSDKESQDARAAAAKATDDHTAAMERNTTAATAGAVAFNRLGMAAAGLSTLGFGEALKQAIQFEEKTTQVGAALGETTQQIAANQNALLQLAPQVGRSLQDLNDASLIVGKMGWKDAGDNIKIVGASAQLASIEGAPLIDVVKTLATSMKDFNFSVSEAPQIGSMLRAAIGDAGTTMADYTGAMHTLQSTFKLFASGKDQATTLSFFAQMNALLAQGTKNGTSADQTAQQLVNTIQHMITLAPKQQAMIDQLAAQAPAGSPYRNFTGQAYREEANAKGPMFAMQDLMGLVRSQVGPDGQHIVMDEMRKSADLQALMKGQYAALSPQLRSVADSVIHGDPNLKQLRIARMSSGAFSEWLNNFKKASGFDVETGKYQGALLPGTQMTIPEALKELTGTQFGFMQLSQDFGTPQASAQTQQIYKDQMGAKSEGNNVEGWDRVLKTAATSLKQMNAEIQVIATTVGTKILPEFKGFVTVLKDILGWLGNNKAALDGLITAVTTLGAVWAATKIISTISNIQAGLTKLMGSYTRLETAEQAAAREAAAIGPATVKSAETGVAANSKLEKSFLAVGNRAMWARGAMAAAIGAGMGAMSGGGIDAIAQGGLLGSLMAGGPIAAIGGLGLETYGYEKLLARLFGAGKTSKSSRPLRGFNDVPGAWGTWWPEGMTPAAPDIPSLLPGSETDINPGDYPDDGGDSGGGGKKAKRTPLPGITSPDQIQFPSGTENDPLYVDPADGFKGMMGGKDNPLDQFTHPNGLWGKHGLFGDIAGLMTTFLAELALGNPMGQLAGMPGGGKYAWWYRGGDKGGFGKAEEASNRLANAFDRLNEALARGYGPGTPQYDIAARNYANAQIAAGRAGVGGGAAPSGMVGGGRQGVARAIYDAAIRHGYSPQDAISIGAYAVGESGLNPGISGGVQGDDEVIGLFQEKGGFARAGGINPGQRGDASSNIEAYLNNLDRSSGNIYSRLRNTSQGGPIYTGGTAVMPGLESQFRGALGPLGGGADGQSPSWWPTGGQGGPGLRPGQAPDFFGAGGGGLPFPLSPAKGGGWGPGKEGNWAVGRSAGLGGIPAGFTGGGPTLQRTGGINQSPGGFETGSSKPGFSLPILAEAGAAGAMGADAFAPGSGAVVQLAMQEANRGAQALGEAAATVAGEFPLETFFLSGKDLSGKNVDMSKSWFGKVAGGVLGAHMNVPNSAGGGGFGQDPNQTNPAMKKTDNGPGQGGDQGNNNNYGVNIGKVDIHNGQNMDDMVKAQNQGLMSSPGGAKLSRGAG